MGDSRRENVRFFLKGWILEVKTRDFRFNWGFEKRKHEIFGLNEGFAKRKRVIFA